jgi:hypothetical protein
MSDYSPSLTHPAYLAPGDTFAVPGAPQHLTVRALRTRKDGSVEMVVRAPRGAEAMMNFPAEAVVRKVSR